MNGSFSSRLPAGKGVSPRGAMSARRVGPAGSPDGASPNIAYITQEECTARGGIYGTDPTGNAEFACTLPPTSRMGSPPTQADDCIAKGGHYEPDPTGQAEFTCVYPLPTNMPVLPGLRRPTGWGTGDSNTSPNGTGDVTGSPPMGTGDSNTGSNGTGDRTGGVAPGTGDQNRPSSGTGDRVGGFPRTGDAYIPVGGNGDVFVPGSGVGDRGIPREWIQTTCAPRVQMAETCTASHFGAPYHGHPWSGASFGSQFSTSTPPAVMPMQVPGCIPCGPSGAARALRPAGEAMYVINDPMASAINFGLLALGGYAGWKVARRLFR